MSPCDICQGSATITIEGIGEMPCPYCRPDEAREAASIYDVEPDAAVAS